MEYEKVKPVKLLRTRAYMVFINLYIFLGTGVTGLVAWTYHAAVVVWIGAIVFLLVPIVLKRQLMNLFRTEVKFILSEGAITIQYNENELPEGGELSIIKLTDIATYRYEDGIGQPFLKLYLKDGRKFAFDFEHRNDLEVYILDLIIEHISAYNANEQATTKIRWRPAVLATKGGLVLIICLAIGWSLLSLYLVFHQPKTIPFSTIGGILLFIQVIVLRKKELQRLKEENNN